MVHTLINRIAAKRLLHGLWPYSQGKFVKSITLSVQQALILRFSLQFHNFSCITIVLRL